eukprot:CAMPEP_0118664682 /NCGR_PEP_ID=MMETSP0785-20121206/18164_1 /TAXON_ID=91992 /ORGANISM="Bolidomonas pacifica, Strain CCMP 1866" /LENGTH=504 /DNA_ID=CAMNT_0006558647 /DNA_START=130 /DNA_END=1640 /DNA_ORIENTATION=-
MSAQLERQMKTIYASLKPKLDNVMIKLSTYRKSLLPSTPPSTLISLLLSLHEALESARSALSAFPRSQLLAVCLAKMSAFILLPFAATIQNLSAQTTPPPPEEQAKKNNCIEQSAMTISMYCSYLTTSLSTPISLLSGESFRNTLVSLVMGLPISPEPKTAEVKLEEILSPPLIASITQTALSVSKHTPNRDASHQLSSMHTLTTLISSIPKYELWVSIFPGTVGGIFKVLYDSITSKHKSSACIDAFQVLLKAACDDGKNGLEERGITVEDLLNKKPPHPPNPSNPLLDLNLTRSNLTPLLTLILHNTRLHPSLKLRKSCASLTTSLLLKSRLTLKPLTEALFDTLVILTSDDMDEVKDLAKKGVEEIKGSVKDSTWRSLRATQIVNRLLALLPMTPSLLPHPPSISAHVRLLTGYFNLCDNLLFFTLSSNIDILIDALCMMFQPETSAPIATGGKGTVAFKNSSGFYLPRFRYLSNDNLIDSCNDLVHVIAARLAEDGAIDG